jgi:hypothetical protein
MIRMKKAYSISIIIQNLAVIATLFVNDASHIDNLKSGRASEKLDFSDHPQEILHQYLRECWSHYVHHAKPAIKIVPPRENQSYTRFYCYLGALDQNPIVFNGSANRSGPGVAKGASESEIHSKRGFCTQQLPRAIRDRRLESPGKPAARPVGPAVPGPVVQIPLPGEFVQAVQPRGGHSSQAAARSVWLKMGETEPILPPSDGRCIAESMECSHAPAGQDRESAPPGIDG